MKYLPTIAGALLGLTFLGVSIPILLHLITIPEMPDHTSAAYHFMTAFAPTGYLMFVKSLECLGGILVAIPRTRNLGLLVLGPIIINILAFHTFVERGGLMDPMIIGIVLLALYLLWTERRAFAGLVNR